MPEVKENIDAVITTIRHSEIIQSKPLLKDFYKSCYHFFKCNSDLGDKKIRVELGAGAGFVKSVMPEVLTSDVVQLPDIDLICRGESMPFADNSVDNFYMMNVFHHVPDVSRLLAEISRCLVTSGSLIMVEPANTLFSRLIYKYFHHEPFLSQQIDWQLPEGGGRLSNANGALAWMVFKRDKEIFDKLYPSLCLEMYDEFCPLSYLLSGGLSSIQFIPGRLGSFISLLERAIEPINSFSGMFVKIIVRKL